MEAPILITIHHQDKTSTLRESIMEELNHRQDHFTTKDQPLIPLELQETQEISGAPDIENEPPPQ